MNGTLIIAVSLILMGIMLMGLPTWVLVLAMLFPHWRIWM